MSNNYTIAAYGPNGAITVTAGQVNTSLSLKLLGRGAPGYGFAFAENTVRQLSNFANTTAPSGAPLVGQLWFDTSSSSMKVYNGSGWKVLFGETNTGGAVLTAPQGGTGLSPNPYVNSTNTGDANKVIQVNSTGTGYEYATLDELTDACLRRDKSTAPTANNTVDLGTTALRFKTIYAGTFDGVATSAQFADLAERYEANEALEPGDVVELGGDKEICKTTRAGSTDVFGVISTAPAYMMNSEAGNDETHPYVALVGRAPVKVVGKVRKGERLVSSNFPGVAVAIPQGELPNVFQVIGRALADKDTDDIGTVEATIGAK